MLLGNTALAAFATSLLALAAAGSTSTQQAGITIVPVLPSLSVSPLGTGRSGSTVAATCTFDEMQAIDMFCGGITGTYLGVPSSQAEEGLTYNGFHVSINGGCSPTQWVTVLDCSLRFFEACTLSTKEAYFGNDRCQHFAIDEVTYD